MTESNPTVTRWMDMTDICIRFGLSNHQVGNIARTKSRYVDSKTVEFEIEGVTIRKVGMGKVARYRLMPDAHSLYLIE
jgi:hypothetical protein